MKILHWLFASYRSESSREAHWMNRYRILYEGRVQGVGFRYFAFHTAQFCRLSGFVRNMDDGRVEVEVQGTEEAAARFMKIIRDGNGCSSISHYTIEQIAACPGEHFFSVKY